MAVRTLWVTNTTASGCLANYLQWDGTAPAAATSAAGWTVAKLAAGNYWRWSTQSKQAVGYSTTPAPDAVGPYIQARDSFRLANPDGGYTGISGSFAAGNWQIYTRWAAVVAGGSQDGRVRMRVWKGDYNGVTVTEITTAVLDLSTITNLSIGTPQESSITWAAPAITLATEYLFFSLAWYISGAGGSTSADVMLRVGNEGNGCKIITTDFTEIVPGVNVSGAIGTVNVSAPEATVSLVDAVLKLRTCVGAGK